MRKRRARLIATMIGLAVVWLGHESWAVLQMHKMVPLVNGYTYYHFSSGMAYGVAIWLPPDAGEINKYPENPRVMERADCGNVDDNAMPKHMVGPDVDGYRVYRKIITGHVTSRTKDSDGYRIPERDRGVAGYFVIDVRKDIFYDGLSKQEYLKKLRSFGIKDEPRLYKPSIYDKLLGRNKPSDK